MDNFSGVQTHIKWQFKLAIMKQLYQLKCLHYNTKHSHSQLLNANYSELNHQIIELCDIIKVRDKNTKDIPHKNSLTTDNF